jgi:N-acetylmuramoyl-L-alanine amidase
MQGTDKLSRDVIVDSVLAGPKVIHSHKLAIDVQNGMMRHLKGKYPDVKNGGAKPEPFYILVGASRPSILVEVGYLTNPKERARLSTSDYQQRIARGIAEGVGSYLDNRKRQQGF